MNKYRILKIIVLLVNFLIVLFLVGLTFLSRYNIFHLWISISLFVTSFFLLIDGFFLSNKNDED